MLTDQEKSKAQGFLSENPFVYVHSDDPQACTLYWACGETVFGHRCAPTEVLAACIADMPTDASTPENRHLADAALGGDDGFYFTSSEDNPDYMTLLQKCADGSALPVSHTGPGLLNALKLAFPQIALEADAHVLCDMFGQGFAFQSPLDAFSAYAADRRIDENNIGMAYEIGQKLKHSESFWQEVESITDEVNTEWYGEPESEEKSEEKNQDEFDEGER